MRREVLLPQMGMGMHEGVIVEWLRQPGEVVAEGDSLVEVEIEKTEIVLAMPFTGTIVELLVGVGETVPVFSPIATVDA